MEQLWWNAPEALSTTEYESILSRTQVDEKFVVDSAVTLSGKSDVASLEMYTAIKSSEREVLSSREQEDATSREKDLDSLLNSL